VAVWSRQMQPRPDSNTKPSSDNLLVLGRGVSVAAGVSLGAGVSVGVGVGRLSLPTLSMVFYEVVKERYKI